MSLLRLRPRFLYNISDGQPVNASASNTAWASKTADNTSTGKQTLARAGSGSTVTDVQQDINDLKTDIGTLETTVPAIQSDISDLQSLSGVADGATDLGTFTGSVIPDNSDNKEAFQALETEVELKEDVANKGVADGYASLDSGGKVPVAQLPNSIMEYLGTWNATTNTPTLIDGTGNAGDVYITDVAGTQDLGSGSQTFAVGDWVVYNGAIWQKSSNSNAVASVNGFTGVVNLGLDDLSDVDEAAPATRDVLRYDGADWKGEQLDSSANDTATGSNATLAAVTTSVVRLTNASLVSVDMIPAGFSAQKVVIENKTTVQITINNELGATAANRILTGTGADLSLAIDASLQLVYDSTSSRWMVVGGTGSGGSGSGGINYISNPNATSVIAPWVAYADAAGTSPVDGTGGSPTVTVTRDTNSLTIGTTSILITKDAANRQGEGASIDFTIDTALRFSPVELSCFINASANFVFGSIDGVTPSDVRWFVYDVTNSVLITPFPNTLVSNIGRFVGSFQATGSTSYRLIAHIGTTNALAWTLALGEVVASPSDPLFIQADSDWYDLTPAPAISNIGVQTTTYAQGRKNGTNFEMRMKFSGATYSANPLKIPIPSGIVPNIATDTLILGNFGSTYAAGDMRISPIILNADKGFIQFSRNNSASVFTVINSNIVNNNDVITFNVSFPIVGWTSGYATPSVSAVRVPVSFQAYKNGGSITSNTTIPSWTAIVDDSVGAFSLSTGEYTLKYPGNYSGTVQINTTANGTESFNIYVNGVDSNWTYYMDNLTLGNFSFELKNLKVGDIVTVRSSANKTIASTTITKWTMVKDADPSAFLTIPKVAYLKYIVANNTNGGSSTTSYTKRTINTLQDPYGIASLSGDIITLQPGRYKISGGAQFVTQASTNTRHKLKLRQTSGTPADIIIGQALYVSVSAGTDVGSYVPLNGYFDISVATNFEIQARSTNAYASVGWGAAANFGDSEVYLEFELQKLL